MIHLVMGVSSAGKSAFIQSQLEAGQWRDLPLYMAYELDREAPDPRLAADCVIHYSLFRPFHNRADQIDQPLTADPILRALLDQADRLQAYLVVSPRAVVAHRMLNRAHARVEPGLRAQSPLYRSDEIFELLCALDWVDFHQRWIELLRSCGVAPRFVQAEGGQFRLLESARAALAIVADARPVTYAPAEIDAVLRAYHFEYQRIAVAGGQVTAGQDRSATARLIDADLTGRSLLDIGCGYGYFCFEAEDRGATRVLGTELKPHRYLGCLVLRELLGRRAQFLRRDLFSEPLAEVFDVVLLLNVIHHLKEPVRGLRLAAQYCREKLIIEFPTLADPKFHASLPAKYRSPAYQGPAWMDPDLPLIGVSLLTGQDQTFLFSPTAIFRILMEHERLFSRIEFMPSPMAAERCVAICYK